MPSRGSVRQFVLERDGYRCQYCGAPAVHVDHIIPRALRRRHRLADNDPAYMAAACSTCNWRKGTRKLATAAWADRLHELPGRGWRVWHGDPESLRSVVR